MVERERLASTPLHRNLYPWLRCDVEDEALVNLEPMLSGVFGCIWQGTKSKIVF
jgi:hypothetical protein